MHSIAILQTTFQRGSGGCISDCAIVDLKEITFLTFVDYFI